MRLNKEILPVIERVLTAAESKPADVALRQCLRSERLIPANARMVSQAVFTFFRWFGFLDGSKSRRLQMEQAMELAAQFDANARNFSDRDLLEKAFPSWLHEVMRVTPAFAREFQREPRLWLRARPGTGAELARSLGDCDLHPSVPDALSYRGDRDLFHTDEFRRGAFEIQDLSSQIVGLACAPNSSEAWWDACAGQGGKTLHLCDLMQNKGLVWASDPAQWRLDILKRRAARARLFNYRLKLWTPEKQLPTKAKFDGILVDAPCSGIGTWGRNPHARWTTTPADVAELAELQSKILERVSCSLKPGGRLVYSVCTLAEAETSRIADVFETLHSRFQALPVANLLAPENKAARHELLPQVAHANGMFFAAWRFSA